MCWSRFAMGLWLVAWVLAWPSVAVADGSDAPQGVLRVGTKEAPPFVVRRADGALDGPSIRLWRELAEAMGVAYALEERDLSGLLHGLEDGSLDVSVAAITVTSEREATVDFTHPFHTTGLAIAARRRAVAAWLGVVGTVFSGALLQLVAMLAAIQLLVGAVVWRLERRTNPGQFGESGARGLLAGFWWSTVTMTTVGYGDKSPKTVPGRVVALGWMLCSVVIVSTFTATIASQMTVERLESEMSGPADLARVRVGVIANTTSERYARAAGLDFRRFGGPDEALQALAAKRIDAVVHDAPLLERWLQGELGEALEILPARFERQDYAIALPEGSALREPINRLLPQKVRGGVMDDPQLPGTFGRGR